MISFSCLAVLFVAFGALASKAFKKLCCLGACNNKVAASLEGGLIAVNNIDVTNEMSVEFNLGESFYCSFEIKIKSLN